MKRVLYLPLLAILTAIGGLSYWVLGQTGQTFHILNQFSEIPLSDRGPNNPPILAATPTPYVYNDAYAFSTPYRVPNVYSGSYAHPGTPINNYLPYFLSVPHGISSSTATPNPLTLSYPTWVGSGYPILEDGKFRILKPGPVMSSDDRKKADEARKQIDEAIRTLRSEASDSEALGIARSTVSNFLGALFDFDHQKRKDQLALLEEQVAKLKKQIEKRESSKQELIDLRIKIFENEAVDLPLIHAWANLTNGYGFTTAQAGPDANSYSYHTAPIEEIQKLLGEPQKPR